MDRRTFLQLLIGGGGGSVVLAYLYLNGFILRPPSTSTTSTTTVSSSTSSQFASLSAILMANGMTTRGICAYGDPFSAGVSPFPSLQAAITYYISQGFKVYPWQDSSSGYSSNLATIVSMFKAAGGVVLGPTYGYGYNGAFFNPQTGGTNAVALWPWEQEFYLAPGVRLSASPLLGAQQITCNNLQGFGGFAAGQAITISYGANNAEVTQVASASLVNNVWVVNLVAPLSSSSHTKGDLVTVGTAPTLFLTPSLAYNVYPCVTWESPELIAAWQGLYSMIFLNAGPNALAGISAWPNSDHPVNYGGAGGYSGGHNMNAYTRYVNNIPNFPVNFYLSDVTSSGNHVSDATPCKLWPLRGQAANFTAATCQPSLAIATDMQTYHHGGYNNGIPQILDSSGSPKVPNSFTLYCATANSWLEYQGMLNPVLVNNNGAAFSRAAMPLSIIDQTSYSQAILELLSSTIYDTAAMSSSSSTIARPPYFNWCFKPNELILGDNKPISQLLIGAHVFGRNSGNTVKNTFIRQYSGKMVRVTAIGIQPFESTPDHPVMVITGKNSKPHTNTKVIFSEPYWKASKDLIPKKMGKDGDYLLIPRLHGDIDVQTLDLSQFLKRKIGGGSPVWFKNRGYPLEVTLDEDFAWLLGIYTAEGHQAKTLGAVFSLNRNERELQEKIVKIAKNLGYKARTYHPSKDSSSSWVIIPSNTLKRALTDWCGKGAQNKQIPEFILRHKNTGLGKAFLDGYFAGDGYRHRESGTETIEAPTVSKLLARQVQLLGARLGLLFSISQVVKAHDQIMQGRMVHCKDRYVIRGSLDGFKSHSRHHVFEDYITVPVRDLQLIDYSGPVCNIETDDNTYLISNIICHNCNPVDNSSNPGRTGGYYENATPATVLNFWTNVVPSIPHCPFVEADTTPGQIQAQVAATNWTQYASAYTQLTINGLFIQKVPLLTANEQVYVSVLGKKGSAKQVWLSNKSDSTRTVKHYIPETVYDLKNTEYATDVFGKKTHYTGSSDVELDVVVPPKSWIILKFPPGGRR